MNTPSACGGDFYYEIYPKMHLRGYWAGLRIFFAAIASYLLAIPGILFFGGCLLAWVCWRFFQEIRANLASEAEEALEQKGYQGSPRRQLWKAMVTITIADVSMSIDNVVAVAAIARDNTSLLIFGLVLSIAFMAFFATMIMKAMTKYAWLSWMGLVFLVYLSLDMIHDGWPEIATMIGMG